MVLNPITSTNQVTCFLSFRHKNPLEKWKAFSISLLYRYWVKQISLKEWLLIGFQHKNPLENEKLSVWISFRHQCWEKQISLKEWLLIGFRHKNPLENGKPSLDILSALVWICWTVCGIFRLRMNGMTASICKIPYRISVIILQNYTISNQFIFMVETREPQGSLCRNQLDQ